MLLILSQIISIVYSFPLSNNKFNTKLNFHSSDCVRNTPKLIPQWLLPYKYNQYHDTSRSSSYMTLYCVEKDDTEGVTGVQVTNKKKIRRKNEASDLEWHYNYEALKHYLYTQNTTTRIPISTIYNCTLPVLGEPWNTYNYSGKLGKWLQEQKTIYKQYENNSAVTKPIRWLPREKLLQELVDQKVLQWNNPDLMPGSELGYHPWYIHYAALLHYYSIYGTCNVPLKTIYSCNLSGYGPRGDNYRYDGHLGKWVNQQLRILNNMCDEKLSLPKIRKFRNLIRKGMLRMYHIYDETSEFERHIKRTTWEQHFDALIQYARIYGTCNIPKKTKFQCILKGKGDNNTDYMYNENLGEWVHRQRLYRQSKWRTALTPDRFNKLQVLEDNGIFTIEEDDFMEFQRVNYDKYNYEYPWEFRYSALVEYGREYGTCNIPRSSTYLAYIPSTENPMSGSLYMGKLGRWLSKQRIKYMIKKLSPDKVSKLMELSNKGMLRLYIPKRELVWLRHYNALLQYGLKNGHHNVPAKTTFECILPSLGMNGEDYEYDLKLGPWLYVQRLQYHNGNLLDHRKMKLQELVDKGTLLWNATEHRVTYKNKIKGEIDWPRNYAALLHYNKTYGTCNIPAKATYECILPGMGENGTDYHYNGKLGVWLDNQKHRMKSGEVYPDRVEKLQQLIDQGLIEMNRRYSSSVIQNNLEYNEREWPRNYAALVHYGQVHGTCNIPATATYECILPGMGDNGTDYEYNRQLGYWVKKQRKNYVANKLRADRVEKLQILVDQGLFSWKSPNLKVCNMKSIKADKEWPLHYAALLHYGQIHGTYNFPTDKSYECILSGMGENGTDYHYNGKLGRWLANQRSSMKMGYLSDDRITKLQALADQGLFDWIRSQPISIKV